MKFLKKKNWIAIALLSIASFLGNSTIKAADPVLVVSVTNVDQLLSDVDYLMESTGTAQFKGFFMPVIQGYLNGIDKTKPIGAALYMDNGEFTPLVFVPVTDLDGFLQGIEDQVGEPKAAGGGVLQLRGPQPLFVKEQGGWAYVGQNVESLDSVPNNPLTVLDGLNEDYSIGVRAYVDNLPAAYREMGISQLEQFMKQNAADEKAEAMVDVQLKDIRKALDGSDQISFGWKIDSQGKSTYFETAVKVKAGTELASQLDQAKKIKTNYSGFVVPGAAVSASVTGTIPEDQAGPQIAQIDAVEEAALEEIDGDDAIEDEAVRDGAKKLISGVFDVIRDTIKSGKMDAGMSVILEEGAFAIAVGGYVSDGAKVEMLVKETIELARNDSDLEFSKLNLDAGKHAGANLHEFSLPIPEDEYVGEALGGELDVCLGAGEKDVYLVIGSDATEKLKKMIDDSKSAGAVNAKPMSLTIKAGPILRFAHSMEGEESLGAIADMLEDTGNDHVRVKVNIEENEVSYRFEIEEGILNAIGKAVEMSMSGGF